jgi:uncharacterized membrane protein
MAGLLGSFIISVTAALLMPFCPQNGPPSFNWRMLKYGKIDDAGWSASSKLQFIVAMTFAGFCGTLLDSLLGALLQASVVDAHTGKVVEGEGGRKVLVSPSGKKTPLKGKDGENTKALQSRRVEVGQDLLDNNAVNFFMALIISVGSMAAASWFWDLPRKVVDSKIR